MATKKTTNTAFKVQSAFEAALVLSIAEAANKVNATERADGVQVRVGLPAAVAINDVITMVLTGCRSDHYTSGHFCRCERLSREHHHSVR